MRTSKVGFSCWKISLLLLPMLIVCLRYLGEKNLLHNGGLSAIKEEEFHNDIFVGTWGWKRLFVLWGLPQSHWKRKWICSPSSQFPRFIPRNEHFGFPFFLFTFSPIMRLPTDRNRCVAGQKSERAKERKEKRRNLERGELFSMTRQHFSGSENRILRAKATKSTRV